MIADYKESSRSTKYILWAIIFFTILIAFMSIVSIYLLKTPILWADEWRHIHGYVFRQDLYHSIFDRQNGHLFIIPNLLYLINFYFFNGSESWLMLINIVSISTTAFLFGSISNSSLKPLTSDLNALTSAAVVALSLFWMGHSNSMFWALGIHQNLAILGASYAAYVLSKNLKVSPRATMLPFIIAATISSFCFSAGSVTWALGFLAALISNLNRKWVAMYFLIGSIGGMATIGYYALSTNGVSEFDAGTFFQAVPAFLGGPFLIVFQLFVPKAILLSLSTAIGIVGLLVFALMIYIHTKDRKYDEHLALKPDEQGPLFLILMALFSVGCGLVIALGRVKGDIEMAIEGRFYCWSVLFWVSLLGFSLIVIVQNFKRTQFRIPIYLATIVAGILFFNLVKIDLQLTSLNTAKRGMIDLIVHPDAQGPEIQLWQPNLVIPEFRRIIHEVSDTMKIERKNFYKSEWAHLMNNQIVKDTSDQAFNLSATFELMDSSYRGDLFLEGYVETTNFFKSMPKAVIFVYHSRLIGVGIPYSNRDRRKSKSARWSNALNMFPRPFGQFPGVSNYYYGQLNVSEISESTFDNTDIETYAWYGNEKYEKLKVKFQ